MARWNRIRSLDDLPDEVKVRVDFYRESDHDALEKALASGGDGAALSFALPSNEGALIRVTKSELLAYWLFEDKDLSDPEMSNFESICDSVEDALPDLKNHFEANGRNLRAKAKPSGSERPNDISTRLGVAVGLCVANKVLGLTRADWAKISKTYLDGLEELRFDYSLAATPVGYAAVENKGSIVKNNRLKKGLRKHEQSIIEKKRHLRAGTSPGFLIGTIAVADDRHSSRLKCWLLDPPLPDSPNLPPHIFGILNRLKFQRVLVQMVFPKSEAIHRAMEEREREIFREKTTDFFEQKALTYPSGTKIALKWEANRKVQALGKNGLWVGKISRLKHGHILFLGAGRRWVDATLRQELRFLGEFDGISESSKSHLKWHATATELALLSGFKFMRGEMEGGLTPVSLPVTLHETKGGFAFALIENRRKVIRDRNFEPLIPRTTKLE